MSDQSEWDQLIQQANNMPPGYGVGGATIKAAQKITAELDSLKGTIMVLSTNIASQTANLTSAISGSVKTLTEEGAAIEQRLDDLNANIKDFNKSTSILTGQANRLIRWYVILTFVIAIATVISLLKTFGML
jgi:hypothetical protein